MADTTLHDWEAELQVLLETIKSHPSADLARERDRVVVLQKLITDHMKNESV